MNMYPKRAQTFINVPEDSKYIYLPLMVDLIYKVFGPSDIGDINYDKVSSIVN